MHAKNKKNQSPDNLTSSLKDDHQARFIAAMLKYRNGSEID